MGVALYLLAEPRLKALLIPRLTLLACCVLLANLPDFDLLFPLFVGEGLSSAYHRGVTHTLAFAAFIGVLVALAQRGWNRQGGWFVGTLGAALVASHLLLDVLTFDTRPPHGVPLNWPIDGAYVIAGWTPFLPTRHGSLSALMSLGNLKSILWDALLLTPLVLVSYLLNLRWSRRAAR